MPRRLATTTEAENGDPSFEIDDQYLAYPSVASSVTAINGAYLEKGRSGIRSSAHNYLDQYKEYAAALTDINEEDIRFMVM